MRIIGDDQKNNGQNFWEILERIISRISSIIGAGLFPLYHNTVLCDIHFELRYYMHTYISIEFLSTYIINASIAD